MAHWLMKSEPDVYGWDDLIAEGEGTWDGVRNHAAAGHLKAMAVGDTALFYHSNIGKEAVGIITISAPAFPDPTEPEGTRWVAVKVKPLARLKQSIPLSVIKGDDRLYDMAMRRQSRLSVSPVTAHEWAILMDHAGGDPLG
ncbi:EVE domain-containing protein [Sphingomonas lacunae]|uniref:EVE domain-containing protein n=1 Tax=Sphingomonas lacunae TaxID=2698828 RepID=A0A6M4ARF2_9SPHN|nr:EVE domain-containing protein [Sphingomonas lacunae]QJQ31648.1 EVE domain-containing protein [Sphingomonas lacunae]